MFRVNKTCQASSSLLVFDFACFASVRALCASCLDTLQQCYHTHHATGAPICINTVLWNTIKLLFPHHAANAPESPADAILTPSRSNTAAMAHALAAVPNAVMRQMANAPFNPPRYLDLLLVLEHSEPPQITMVLHRRLNWPMYSIISSPVSQEFSSPHVNCCLSGLDISGDKVAKCCLSSPCLISGLANKFVILACQQSPVHSAFQF